MAARTLTLEQKNAFDVVFNSIMTNQNPNEIYKLVVEYVKTRISKRCRNYEARIIAEAEGVMNGFCFKNFNGNWTR
jgi:hypothetical protein